MPSKAECFNRFNHLYTPCRTGNTTFYKLIVKAMQMPPDDRRVFAVKLTNSLAIIFLSTNTRHIVGIFITDCDFKSRVFCWFNLLSQRFRDGDISSERKTNVTSDLPVKLLGVFLWENPKTDYFVMTRQAGGTQYICQNDISLVLPKNSTRMEYK